MNAPTTTPVTSARPAAGRRLLAAGLVLPVLAVLGYAGQLALHQMRTPWYVPALATLGAALVAVALWRRPTVWRGLALLLVVLVGGAAWLFVLMTRLPAYAGPLAPGQPVPAFATARADGAPFTHRDLAGGPATVLVFFRGRW